MLVIKFQILITFWRNYLLISQLQKITSASEELFEIKNWSKLRNQIKYLRIIKEFIKELEVVKDKQK